MKLDAGSLRYMSPDDFRVLAAVEAGMRNHDLVPTELISSSAGVRGGGAHKILGNLLRLKLVYHESRQYDGYRLTYGGYDFLALRSLLRMGAVSGVGMQIGVGKESDIFLATNEDGEQLVLKLQRLGRTSFRAIKKVRSAGQGGGLGVARLPAGLSSRCVRRPPISLRPPHTFPPPLSPRPPCRSATTSSTAALPHGSTCPSSAR
jgi:RIO-like serine/threonine protein kinase